MTEYRWLCQPVQPSVPTAPPTPAHPSYIIDSALPPVSGDEFAMLQAEATDLRRELAAAQALCDAYADDYRRAISQRETLDRQLLRERVALKYTESVIECQRALEADLRRQLAEATELKGYFTLNADRNLDPETKAALSEVARAVYMNHLESDNADLRRQLAEAKNELQQMTIRYEAMSRAADASALRMGEAQADAGALRRALVAALAYLQAHGASVQLVAALDETLAATSE